MSAPQWKPGDVAMVTAQPFQGPERTEKAWVGFDGCWHFNDGHAVHATRDDLVTEARPLVVIDPEDTLQVQRLVEEFWANGTDDCNDLDAMTKGLRSLVTDPKPEEPQGLGAVVELVGGEVLVRTEGQRDTANWADKYGDFHWWADIDVARVLTGGWSE